MVAPDVLVILDGASEPWDGARPTSLERARTPALDALARRGELARARTVPAGLPAGSEVAIPVLLGWTPPAPVDRAAIEAAAHRIAIPAGERPWRVDVHEGAGREDVDTTLGALPGAATALRASPPARANAATTLHAAAALRAAAPGYMVHPLAGHRLLLVGPAPLPDAARAPHLRVWPDGASVPRALDASTVVVAARGAGAGVAALLGARVVVPDGATGGPSTRLEAKADAALAALAAGAPRVVVHVGGADEAAHVLDAAGKVAFLERADRELIAPLAAALRHGTLRVCPDHGCDPATGAHDADPVPHLTWRPGGSDRGPRRLTERAVAALDVTDLTGTR